MGRIWSLTAAAVALSLGSGCIHVHVDDAGKLKAVNITGSETEPAKTAGNAKVDPAVKPAAAFVPVPQPLSLSRLTTRSLGPKVPATEIAVVWQSRLGYLPDPSKQGATGAGLVGQMFLFGPGPKGPLFAPADGTLTVDLYDETPRPGVAPDHGPLMERWQFDRETLRKLVTVDEKFGKSYALFLPWPTYRPDIARVRLTVRYDPEAGHPLYAAASMITIDTTSVGQPDGGQISMTRTGAGGLSNAGPLGVFPPIGSTPLGAPSPAGMAGPTLGPPPGTFSPPGNLGAPPAAFAQQPRFAPPPPSAQFPLPLPVPPPTPGVNALQPAGGPISPANNFPVAPAAWTPPPGNVPMPPGGLQPLVITPQR